MALTNMARSLCIALATLTLSGSARSQSLSSSSVVAFAIVREPTSGATLVKRADYVSFAVTVTSTETDFANRVKLIGEGKNVVTEALAKQGVRYETGAAYLVLDQPSSGSFSSGSAYNRPNEVVVQVLVPLAKSGDNLFDATSRVATSLSKLQLPSRVSLRYSPFRLAVENPERHRKELVTKIADEVSIIKGAMRSSGKVNVSGLASPIQVRQLNDTDVELSLSYAVSIELP